MSIKLKLVRNNEWGEYIVEWREDGKLSEAKSYYSGGINPDHKADAEATMRRMQERIDAMLPGYRPKKVSKKKTAPKKRRK